METRQERTGWRDEEISERHRQWGFNCPAVDIDFLMVEYDVGRPAAVVEYKHHQAWMPDIMHPSYKAIRSLADASGIPFLLTFYWPGGWTFRVHPCNKKALEFFRYPNESVDEDEYVKRLYAIRGRAIPEKSTCKT
jgi:hypothetical protein